MSHSSVRDIKRSQKEAALYKVIAQLFLDIIRDNQDLQGLSINRVKLSADKSFCTIFFYSSKGKAHFEQVVPTLILYKPSLRTALAKAVPSRYVPELTFKYDNQFEKQIEIEQLLDTIKGSKS